MHHLGATRSSYQRDHLLQTPDTFVRTPLPGLEGGVAIVHASPVCGAGFTMATLELEASASYTPLPGQCLLYLLCGSVELSLSASKSGPQVLGSGAFAFFPPQHAACVRTNTAARVVLIQKTYDPLPGTPAAGFFTGHEPDITPTALAGDPDLLVRTLLPASPAFDFAVNTMTYTPGASLSQVEVHYMEHGLLMLEGEGVYRLGDRWYPVTAGDFIWMAPFCPQWFGALGKRPAKYLIYKNFNRYPQPSGNA